MSENHGLDTDDRVCFYENDFYPLSNFSSFRLFWSSHDFDTSEHAYHWEKFRSSDDDADSAHFVKGAIGQMIRTARSAHEAFKLAEVNKQHVRADWNDVRVGIMRNILRAKVQQHEYVKRKLLQTGDRELVENSWRDSFWGEGADMNGLNMLGRLWTEIRSELRGEQG